MYPVSWYAGNYMLSHKLSHNVRIYFAEIFIRMLGKIAQIKSHYNIA